MPDQDFLQVHFAISQILQVSEFGETIRKALDEISVLDCHGLNPSGGTDVGGLLSKMMLININAETKSGASENVDTDDR